MLEEHSWFLVLLFLKVISSISDIFICLKCIKYEHKSVYKYNQLLILCTDLLCPCLDIVYWCDERSMHYNTNSPGNIFRDFIREYLYIRNWGNTDFLKSMQKSNNFSWCVCFSGNVCEWFLGGPQANSLLPPFLCRLSALLHISLE